MTAETLDGCAVLVLEDAYLIAEDLRRLLVSAGATVLGPYRKAADAVAAVERDKPSCALIDINLGEGANFAPAKALLAREVPVVLISGYGPEFVPPELKALPHIVKPVRDKEVLETVGLLCAAGPKRRAPDS